MDSRPSASADRFTGLAGTYSAHRPTYPRAVFTALMAGLPSPVRLVDVGCGTGISTRLAAEAGCDAIGVDPNRDMLEEARRGGDANGRIRWHLGSAEETGLAAGAAEIVLCAQAFHWFRPEEALREFHRLLRPGGRVALLWNLRDQVDSLTREYDRIVTLAAQHIDPTQRDARAALDGPLMQSTLFANPRRLFFESPQVVDEGGLVGRAHSASYFPQTEPLRTELTDALRSAFRRHAVDGQVTLRQTARLTLAERADNQ